MIFPLRHTPTHGCRIRPADFGAKKTGRLTPAGSPSTKFKPAPGGEPSPIALLR